MKHRLGPFVDVKAAFIGFPRNEMDEVEALLRSFGGQLVDATSPVCTHIVSPLRVRGMSCSSVARAP